MRPCSRHEAFILHPSSFMLHPFVLILDLDVALNTRDFAPCVAEGGGIFRSRVTQTLTEPCGPLAPLFHVAASETVLAAGFGHVPAAGAETCRAAAFGQPAPPPSCGVSASGRMVGGSAPTYLKG